MGVSLLEISIVVAVLAGAALWRAHSKVGDGLLGQWAEAHGLELTPESKPVVARYLRRARILRTWGAVAGLLAPTLIRLALGEPVRVAGVGEDGMAPGELGLVFVGYLAGAVLAEVMVSRPFDPARRSAALLPRELSDYLPPRFVAAQRALAAACVAGSVAIWLVPYGPDTASPTWASMAGFAVLIVAFAVGVERLELWVVRRPQPFVSEPLLAADDAIRAQSVHSLAGAGMAFLLFTFSLVALVLASSDVAILRLTMWAPGVLALLGALVACQYSGERAWRVRRGPRSPTPAASA